MAGNSAAAGGGFAYFLGLIGALVWNWHVADSFMGYIWGFLEALVWPGFLVYELFALAAGAT